MEAIRDALQVLPQDSVYLRFLMQAVGDISASDVDLARASEAIIVGFNVGVPTAVQAHAENRNVEIRLYRVIYELVDDMRKAMEGLLELAEVKFTKKHFNFSFDDFHCFILLHNFTVLNYLE